MSSGTRRRADSGSPKGRHHGAIMATSASVSPLVIKGDMMSRSDWGKLPPVQGATG
jgi:hypothetical protein